MTQIPLAYGSSDRGVGDFPALISRNVFAEAPASDPKSMALVGRAGLEAFATAGGGPIRAVFQRAGLFDGDALILSGQTLYRVSENASVTAFTGTVAGTSRVSMDAGPDGAGLSELRIATGTEIYLASGTSVAAEAFPDSAGVTAVLYIRGFWIAIRADTQVLYSRVPGDLVWDAITFTSAEYEPDKAVGLARLGDTVLVFGETSLEPFALTGNATNPIEPYGGSAQDVGCRARDTIVNLADGVFAVGDDSAVYKFTPSPKLVSDNALSERIRLSDPTNLRAWGFRQDQHAFYVLSLGTETVVYDDSNGLWNPWASLGYDYFRAHLGAEVSGRVVCADVMTNSGQLWRMTPEKLTDDGDEIERIATAYYPLPEGHEVCASIVLECARGKAPLTGQGSDPLVGMRYSENLGKTWSPWRFRTLGAAGRYSDIARWNGNGTIRAPGRMFQLKSTDPTVIRFSKLLMNVPA